MSRTVLRYVNGKAVWSDNEPARARRIGHGGMALGYLAGTTIVTESERERQLRQNREGTARWREKNRRSV